ncbi:MAG TPA: YhdB family protein [Pseudogracilibacillus sp.]|nr:YhdB family protein [Pseudogracilibacillus sp.]
MCEYERALHYLLWCQFDDLFTLMIRTKDDLLEKKIQSFLYAYYYVTDEESLLDSHENLMHYIYHALDFDQNRVELFI